MGRAFKFSSILSVCSIEAVITYQVVFHLTSGSVTVVEHSGFESRRLHWERGNYRKRGITIKIKSR